MVVRFASDLKKPLQRIPVLGAGDLEELGSFQEVVAVVEVEGAMANPHTLYKAKYALRVRVVRRRWHLCFSFSSFSFPPFRLGEAEMGKD